MKAEAGFGDRRVAIAFIALCFAMLTPPRIINVGRLLPVAIPLLLMGIHLAAVSRPQRPRTLVPLVILAFVGWFAATTLWSPGTVNSILESASLVVIVALALLIGSRCTLRELAAGVLIGGLVLLAVSVVVGALIPSYGLMDGEYQTGALRGIFVHRNLLAAVLIPPLIAALVFDFRTARPRLTRFFVVVVLFAGLLSTRSSTGLVAGLVVVLLAVLLTAIRRVRAGYRIFPAVGSVLLVAVGAQLLFANMAGTLELLGRDATLTGRTDIWDNIRELIAEQPVVGYGWGAVWAEGSPIRRLITSGVGFDIPEAHSGYLDVWIQVGMVGLVLLLFVMAITLGRGLRVLFRAESSLVMWTPILIVVVLLIDITETTSTRPFVIFLIVTTYVVMARAVAPTGQGWRAVIGIEEALLPAADQLGDRDEERQRRRAPRA